MAENEGNSGNRAHPRSKVGREGARLRNAESTAKASDSFEGARGRRSELTAMGTTSIEAKHSDRKVEGATGPEQKDLTDRLKRTSESDKKAHLERQLERLERSKRELNLPAERRALIQSDNTAHNTDKAKHTDRKGEGATGREQKDLTERLKRTSESEKKAYLKRQLEGLERGKRELNLPAERRALNQSDNIEHTTERAREQLAKARLTANEIAEAKKAETRAELLKGKLEKAYTQFNEGLLNGTLEKRDVKKIKVDGKDLIIPKDSTHSPDSPEFWNRHGNTKEVYDKLARQYPEIQKQLAGGKTLEEINKDPELKGAANFWYSKQDLVANEYKSYMFVEKGYHRASLAREYDLADVPVSVYEWSEKEKK